MANDRAFGIVNSAAVARIAELTGLEMDPERAAALAPEIQSLRDSLAAIDQIDLTDVEPAMTFALDRDRGASPEPQSELAHMTWTESEVARDRGAVVLIPIGTQEQNGPSAPLSSDTLVAVEVARRVAHQTGAVVAPPICYGYSPMFRHFPGTVSLQPETLRRLIVDICENFIQNGFERLMLVNCHLGNEPIMGHAAEEIRERIGILLGSFNPMSLAETVGKDMYASARSTMGHGAEPMVSVLRSFVPGSVRLGSAKPGGWKDFQGLTVSTTSKVTLDGAVFGLYFGNDEVMETGGLGDPMASDPERGAEILRRVVAVASKYVDAFSRLQLRREPLAPQPLV